MNDEIRSLYKVYLAKNNLSQMAVKPFVSRLVQLDMFSDLIIEKEGHYVQTSEVNSWSQSKDVFEDRAIYSSKKRSRRADARWF